MWIEYTNGPVHVKSYFNDFLYRRSFFLPDQEFLRKTPFLDMNGGIRILYTHSLFNLLVSFI
jgi:hypothetical protein